ncbi:hypothetical protein GQ55_4G087100 [Panicum hallii var. hallii]|uniref:Uncharacterized protein n=1 Tax=Panicum hallii var. hallii TaxID=1504633 RepID=A0A2T7DWM4_9POAL|nr:hypothetical protein GQ55_4G087100 [Panicum hallii var. hallii]
MAGGSDEYYDALILMRRVAAAGGNRLATVPPDSADPFARGPCSADDFNRNSATNQLNTRARMAAAQMGIATLSDISGIDTHAFDRKVLDAGDRRIYFHVTYSGKMPDKTKRFFFPELVGDRGPERVTIVTELRGGRKHYYCC